MSIVLISVEETPAARGDETALAKAGAMIKALQADNLRMREELEEREAAMRRLRMAYDSLRAAALGKII